MRIYNDVTGTRETGNYVGETWFGDTEEELDKHKVFLRNIVTDWPRKLHVWNLVMQMLDNMGYGFNGPEGWK